MKYSLNVESKKIPVCKTMYTLNIGEWSARTWAMEGNNGMNKSFENKVTRRKHWQDLSVEEKIFLSDFLERLNKLPSHYCRKDTDRLYLEQTFQSIAELYRVCVRFCK